MAAAASEAVATAVRLGGTSPKALAAFRAVLDSTKAILFDCDGVLWKGAECIRPAVQAILSTQAKDIDVVYVTNNSSKERSQYVAKIEKVLTPVKATEDRIFSSSFAAAKYLERHGFRGKQVMGIGAPGMLDQLRSVAGVTTIGPELTGKSFDPDADKSLIKEEAGSGRTRAVVVGFDGDYNYCKAAMAGSILRYNADCLFLATNRDMTYPTSSGILLPGGGSVVKSVEAASGREVQVVAGKPSPVLMDLIAGEIGLTKTADGKWPALMVGDRLDTDIAFGNAVGIPTLLVMSGVTSEAVLASALQAAKAADPHAPWTVEQLFDPATIPAHLKVPTFIADDVGVLHTALQ